MNTVRCDACAGTGEHPGGGVDSCPECGGSGVVEE